MKKLVLSSFILLLFVNMQAQELNVSVTVATPKLQTADQRVFEQLETALQEFMNNQKWTDDTFEEEERIEVEMRINVTEERSATQFKADLQILSSRPIFGTTDNTPVLNHQDKDFLFEYEQFQPLEFSRNQYQNNLMAVISFYAYIIIGMDYDSFSPLGGEQYFQTAQEIMNTIPPNVASVYKGWRSVDSNRNRYWIIENIMSPRMRDYRQAMYDYHRQGLDMAHKDLSTGRAVMNTALQSVNAALKSYPRAMIIQMFANAKSEEIIDIFKGGTPNEKNDVIAVMQKVDASKASKYRTIK